VGRGSPIGCFTARFSMSETEGLSIMMSSQTIARPGVSLGRLAATIVATLGLLAVTAMAADAAGPPKEVIQQTNAWGCEGEAGLPPDHCINIRSQGDTGVILVFDPDPRWPQESISFNPASDSRPCPHDPGSPDGTWWSVSDDNQGPWVCHHRP
jgi:hypothetical protein